MAKSKYPQSPILFVDDEANSLNSFRIVSRSEGINNVELCQDSLQVESILGQRDFELVALDLLMPNLCGDELLEIIKRDYPDLPVLMITGDGDVNRAVECMRKGAFDYICKPVERGKLISSLKRAIEHRELTRENRILRDRLLAEDLEKPECFENIVTRNERMRSVFRYCEAIAASQQPVLITGETGTGKELIANSLHQLSSRDGEFVPVNVSGLDENVFTDTIFGHRAGAFTGANENRAGLVEKAENGTLFLDEIADLDNASQLKLLRFLQEREYTPLGSDQTRFSNARVIAASNLDLNIKQQEGTFRRDLFYRLTTHRVLLPPLRERLDDLGPLVEHFITQASSEFGRELESFSDELFSKLKAYSFPGNVRELRAMIFDIVGRSPLGELDPDCLDEYFVLNFPSPDGNGVFRKTNRDFKEEVASIDNLPTLKECSQILVLEAMSRADGKQRVAAEILGISQQALSKRLQQI